MLTRTSISCFATVHAQELKAPEAPSMIHIQPPFQATAALPSLQPRSRRKTFKTRQNRKRFSLCGVSQNGNAAEMLVHTFPAGNASQRQLDEYGTRHNWGIYNGPVDTFQTIASSIRWQLSSLFQLKLVLSRLLGTVSLRDHPSDHLCSVACTRKTALCHIM